MANILNHMPELESDEMAFMQKMFQSMSEEQAQQFTNIYRSRRKDPQIILLTALVGFFGVAGVHRFLIGDVGMGIVYFFTAGFCFIGTIVDVINYKRLAFEYNIKQAQNVYNLIGGQAQSGNMPPSYNI